MPEKESKDSEQEILMQSEELAEENVAEISPPLLRAAEYFKARHIFKYGETPENHPAQKYVESIADRLPKKEGFPLKVMVSLEWGDANAFCLPDGTVIIGAGILREAESEEAIAGIIAHEYVHAYRRHVENRIGDLKKEITLENMARSVGSQRAQEYEADLRACIFDLESVGINPIGYKLYFEKLDEKESDRGIVHGSSLDRALNIASAIYIWLI